jgi:beta-glucanase (GH16 family)
VLQGCNEGTTNINITTPDGYVLTWHDEFNATQPAMPSTTDWWYETGASGWGNNEIENYVAGKTGADTLAYVSDGSLKIKCRKMNGTVYSIRMNTSKSWTYGYFEARLKLPKGKGSWPAFWMLPKNFVSWPLDGEIDIMEEIGAEPNLVSATIHCDAYNSTKNTQKMSRKYVNNAEGSFHVYAMEWTATYIKAYIDGVLYFTFNNDGAGNKSTWPYNVPFYLKLNLAWGGNWGGYLGIDESALPLTYEIDYVRVFQK